MSIRHSQNSIIIILIYVDDIIIIENNDEEIKKVNKISEENLTYS
jgi:hypothetical protein